MTYYDVYCEKEDGEIVHLDRVSTEDEANQIIITEENENIEHHCWYEVTYADEQ